jgi:hypothetical protein
LQGFKGMEIPFPFNTKSSCKVLFLINNVLETFLYGIGEKRRARVLRAETEY